VPAPVLKAFAAKYPKTKLAAAEKQPRRKAARAPSSPSPRTASRKEATLREDGTSVEEE